MSRICVCLFSSYAKYNCHLSMYEKHLHRPKSNLFVAIPVPDDSNDNDLYSHNYILYLIHELCALVGRNVINLCLHRSLWAGCLVADHNYKVDDTRMLSVSIRRVMTFSTEPRNRSTIRFQFEPDYARTNTCGWRQNTTLPYHRLGWWWWLMFTATFVHMVG